MAIDVGDQPPHPSHSSAASPSSSSPPVPPMHPAISLPPSCPPGTSSHMPASAFSDVYAALARLESIVHQAMMQHEMIQKEQRDLRALYDNLVHSFEDMIHKKSKDTPTVASPSSLPPASLASMASPSSGMLPPIHSSTSGVKRSRVAFTAPDSNFCPNQNSYPSASQQQPQPTQQQALINSSSPYAPQTPHGASYSLYSAPLPPPQLVLYQGQAASTLQMQQPQQPQHQPLPFGGSTAKSSGDQDDTASDGVGSSLEDEGDGEQVQGEVQAGNRGVEEKMRRRRSYPMNRRKGRCGFHKQFDGVMMVCQSTNCPRGRSRCDHEHSTSPSNGFFVPISEHENNIRRERREQRRARRIRRQMAEAQMQQQQQQQPQQQQHYQHKQQHNQQQNHQQQQQQLQHNQQQPQLHMMMPRPQSYQRLLQQQQPQRLAPQ